MGPEVFCDPITSSQAATIFRSGFARRSPAREGRDDCIFLLFLVPPLSRLCEKLCHSERSEESTHEAHSTAWILRFAQNDKMSSFLISHGLSRSGLQQRCFLEVEEFFPCDDERWPATSGRRLGRHARKTRPAFFAKATPAAQPQIVRHSFSDGGRSRSTPSQLHRYGLVFQPSEVCNWSVSPPSTMRFCPVMNPAFSPARNKTASAASPAVPIRRSGVSFAIRALTSGCLA